MSINDINNAAAAMNQLKGRYEGFLDDADAQIAARQAAYDALSGNLKGVIASEMNFFGTVDPDVVNPTNVRGGTFRTISDLVAASPACASVKINLLPGKTYTVGARINLNNHKLFIQKLGAGDPPTIKFLAFTDGQFNSVASFMPFGTCLIRFYDCNIELPTAKADDGVPWSSFTGLLGFHVSVPQVVGFYRCLVTGGAAGAQIGIIAGSAAAHSTLGLYTTTLDGPITGVIGGSGATAAISVASATLSNGAQLIGPESTLGTNYITNAV